MKNIKKIILLLSALSLFGMYSCKKQRGCACNTEYFSNGVSYNNVKSDITFTGKMTEKQAKSICENTQSQIIDSNKSLQTATITSQTSCSIH